MKSIHDRARELSAQRGMTLTAAYSLLGRIGAAHRAASRSRSHAAATPAPAAELVPAGPAERLWWRDAD